MDAAIQPGGKRVSSKTASCRSFAPFAAARENENNKVRIGVAVSSSGAFIKSAR
jgi:hypothetical protein